MRRWLQELLNYWRTGHLCLTLYAKNNKRREFHHCVTNTLKGLLKRAIFMGEPAKKIQRRSNEATKRCRHEPTLLLRVHLRIKKRWVRGEASRLDSRAHVSQSLSRLLFARRMRRRLYRRTNLDAAWVLLLLGISNTH